MPLNLKTLLLGLALLLMAAAALLYIVPGRKTGPQVVVYSSVDTDYAEPVFEQFTKKTGITVVRVYDGEAARSRQMMENLLAKKDKPDGDVCWNSELSLSQLLANRDVLQPYDSPSARDIPEKYKDARHCWTGFGCRARVIVFNTKLIKKEDVPLSLDGLSDPRWKGKICVPRPLFGTTLSHFASIYQELGAEPATKLFESWRNNGVEMVESNSKSRELVADGIFALGLSDTDDALEAIARKQPLDFIVPDQSGDWHGAYLVPNTVSILKNCAHLSEARAFVDFLLSIETEKYLAENGAHQIPVRDIPGLAPPIPLRGMKAAPVDIEKLGKDVLNIGDQINAILTKK